MLPINQSYKRSSLASQRGQALIYGIFLMIGGLASIFFLFNTGQLSSEKTKLVNTADAVAYSAGVMHARALNFNAYTNRAMMANEILVAQAVSLASWMDYIGDHAGTAVSFNCTTIYNLPFALGLLKYTPYCMGLAYAGTGYAATAESAVDGAVTVAVVASEAAKINMQLAQNTMFFSLFAKRGEVMQEVADANYLNDGVVKVDSVPLTDHFYLFEGKPFMTLHTGDDRKRFRDTEVRAANLDAFVNDRSWDDETVLGCLPFLPLRGRVDRTGNTQLLDFDEWRARDRASLHTEIFEFDFFSSGCEGKGNTTIATGDRSAKSSGGDFPYSGVPNYYELSDKAREYVPEHSDENKRDPKLRFAIRVTRSNLEVNTSTGKSPVKPTGQFDRFQGAEAKDIMAAVGTSEVFFERSAPRADGQTELASVFNPYWQVHLVPNSTVDVAAAIALQAIP